MTILIVALYKNIENLEKHEKTVKDKVKTFKTFNFTLKLSSLEKPLPPSYKSSNGSVVYTLNLYKRSLNEGYKIVHMKIINYSGFNLLRDGNIPRIIGNIENTHKQTGIHISFKSNKTSFLPSEDIQFSLQVENPLKILILSVSGNFLRYVTFSKNVNSKNVETETVTNPKNKHYLNSRKEHLDLNGVIKGGKVKLPSYNCNESFTIGYFLEVLIIIWC